MSLILYKILVEIPTNSPSDEPPYRTEVRAVDEASGQQVEFDEVYAERIRRLVNQAWLSARPLA
jgi:hypothetical protein